MDSSYTYNPTHWENDVTFLNAENMNNIEQGIMNLYLKPTDFISLGYINTLQDVVNGITDRNKLYTFSKVTNAEDIPIGEYISYIPYNSTDIVVKRIIDDGVYYTLSVDENGSINVTVNYTAKQGYDASDHTPISGKAVAEALDGYKPKEGLITPKMLDRQYRQLIIPEESVNTWEELRAFTEASENQNAFQNGAVALVEFSQEIFGKYGKFELKRSQDDSRTFFAFSVENPTKWVYKLNIAREEYEELRFNEPDLASITSSHLAETYVRFTKWENALMGGIQEFADRVEDDEIFDDGGIVRLFINTADSIVGWYDAKKSTNSNNKYIFVNPEDPVNDVWEVNISTLTATKLTPESSAEESYNPQSLNAQSGKAVNQALEEYQPEESSITPKMLDRQYREFIKFEDDNLDSWDELRAFVRAGENQRVFANGGIASVSISSQFVGSGGKFELKRSQDDSKTFFAFSVERPTECVYKLNTTTEECEVLRFNDTNGITLKDRSTGDAYSVYIDNGEIKAEKL